MGLDRRLLFRVATSKRLERAVKRVPGGEAAAWRPASRYVAGRSLQRARSPTVEMLLERGHGVSVDLFGERVGDPAVADRGARGLPRASSPPCRRRRRTSGCPWISRTWRWAPVRPPPPIASRPSRTPCLPAGACRSGPRRLALADRSTPACSPWPVAAWPIGSAPPCRRISCARRPTPMRWPTPACTSGSSKAPTSSPPAPTHSASRPTSPSCASASGSPSAARRGRWRTHDGRLREALLLAHGSVPVEQLLGVRPEALDELHDRGVPTRVYVPYGADWFRYWMRRLAESRGA